MERPEGKERPERPERRQRQKPGPKPKDSGIYDVHMSIRIGEEHREMLKAIKKKYGDSNSEAVRSMIQVAYKNLEAQGKL